MSKEELLLALGELAKEESSVVDPRLEQLVAGTIDAETRASLERDAKLDENLALALLAFEPISDARMEAIIERTFSASEAEVAPVIELSRWRRARTVIGAVAIAASVTVGVFVESRTPAPIPGYAFTINAGDRPTRAIEEVAPEVPQFSPASLVEVNLRPATRVSGSVTAHAVVIANGVRHAIDEGLRVAESGTVELRGSAKSLFGSLRGEVTLEVTVERKGGLLSGELPPDRSVVFEQTLLLVD